MQDKQLLKHKTRSNTTQPQRKGENGKREQNSLLPKSEGGTFCNKKKKAIKCMHTAAKSKIEKERKLSTATVPSESPIKESHTRPTPNEASRRLGPGERDQAFGRGIFRGNAVIRPKLHMDRREVHVSTVIFDTANAR